MRNSSGKCFLQIPIIIEGRWKPSLLPILAFFGHMPTTGQVMPNSGLLSIVSYPLHPSSFPVNVSILITGLLAFEIEEKASC